MKFIELVYYLNLIITGFDHQENKLGTSKEQNSIDKYARSRVVAKIFKDGKVFNRGFGLVQIPPNQALNLDMNMCVSCTFTT